MIDSYDPDHFDTAVGRFRAFFEELQETLVERHSVLTQCGLALLSRQHVLMTGPPGTAKSQLASLVLGRIIDESTGSPSLFSRQFTENTVQTDLIGPINFKTLMESGRTEHFTDEGMLGSVHAFLDEVLDGRDMLLRSTLNILNERELKQGETVTKGRIECAFMTSNRYIAEVLDSSRETLLAFVDRISFISFIPRGFASATSLATVVRRHGGRFGRHQPRAFLSVQDLDVLQAAADLAYVPEEICDAVAMLVANLDMEMAEARRADPKFQPTRYLSTRSAVQATEVLRAVVVFDKIFNRPDRALQVEHDDLVWLRYLLLINGVQRESIAECIARETDPRERRQLDIMATEAEIFERCFTRIPRVSPKVEPRRLEIGELKAMANTARNSADPEALAVAVNSLIVATESGATDAKQAARLLVDTVGALTAQALRVGLSPTLTGEAPMPGLRKDVTEIAAKLERSAGMGRPLAQWLRDRLLALLDDALVLTPITSDATLELLLGDPSADALTGQLAACFEATERLAALRGSLRQTSGRQAVDRSPAWMAMLSKLEDELVLLWDAKLRLTTRALLARSEATSLASVLKELRPALEAMHVDARRFASLGRDGDLLRRVTGRRLDPIVARAFERLDGQDRSAVVAQVQAVVAELRDAGLDAVIRSDRFVAWTLPSLLRAEAPHATVPTAVRSRAEYDQARGTEPDITITDTLIQVAVCTLMSSALSTTDPAAATESVWNVLRRMDEGQHAQIIAADLARIRRSVERLESWWTELSLGPAGNDARMGDPMAAVALIERVVQSGYLRAMRGDAEPLRIVAEIRQLGEALPGSVSEGLALRRRLEQLDATSTGVLVATLQEQADQAWSATLSSAPSS